MPAVKRCQYGYNGWRRVTAFDARGLFFREFQFSRDEVATDCLLILIERKSTLHTGNVVTERTRSLAEQLGNG